MANLAKLYPTIGESANQYIMQFKKARSRCRLVLPKIEYMRITHNGLHFELWKKFEGIEFNDLFELVT